MDPIEMLLASADFAHARLIGSLDAIAKLDNPAQALAYRPGPGRAHIGWQFMHGAATLHKYMGFVQGKPAGDEALIADFGGGSTPSDDKVPGVEAVREAIEANYAAFRGWIASNTPDSLPRQVVLPGNRQRTIMESIILLTWHITHHQGQIHLSLNMYNNRG